MIVKIQRPLMTNGDEPLCLIYNKKRDVQVEVPLTELESLFPVGEYKIFMHAEMKDTILHIGDPAPWQDW